MPFMHREDRRDATPPIPQISTPLLAGLRSALGLTATTSPDWCVHGRGFAERLWLLGDRVIVSKPIGRSQSQHARDHLHIVEKIVAQHVPARQPYVLCLDWKHLHGSSREARQLWVSAMARDGRLQGLVFCQVSPFFRMNIKLGRRFNIVSYPVEIAADYEEAIARIAAMLGKAVDRSAATQAMRDSSGSGALETIGPMDEVVQFLSMIDWNVPGTAAFDLIPENHRARTLYDAFAIIKMEVDTILEERKLREEELRRARRAAEQADRAKSSFLANMGHEIRAPMNGILGMTRFLIDSPLTAEQAEWVGIIQQSADGLLKIMNDILDITQVEAGRLELTSVDFEIEEVVSRALGIWAHRAAQKGLELTASIDPEVPAKLRGDPGRLAQILLNLVGNAVKFTEKGSVRVSISLERTTDTQVVIRGAVTDTGPGIPEPLRQKIFDAFSKGDASQSRQHGGVGLGLTIARQLVHLMRGQIYLAGSSSEGCTLAFTAALDKCTAAAPEKAKPASSSVPPLGLSTDERHRRRLLLAEDNAINQLVAVKMLERLGCTVEVAGDGQDALAALSRNRFDLVLMDLHMPRMTGIEATRVIRSGGGGVLDPGVPIIAMTTNAAKGDRERCIAAGMDDHVTKPVSMARLAAAIDALLATRSG
jgi:signal transduction histidine kinase/CheY-like chemotaxis protein